MLKIYDSYYNRKHKRQVKLYSLVSFSIDFVRIEMKFDVSIGENFFAPKCADRDEKFDTRNSHAMAYSKCNFLCAFCKYAVKTEHKPNYIDIEEFKMKISEMVKKGTMFKFTGGEPCLNPHLEEELKIVKKNKGIVFLDTNGSLPDVVEKLLKEDLVNVLGISLKGLTKSQATQTAGISNSHLCWDNVLKTIELASKYKNVRTIVTLVAYNSFNCNDMQKFADILNKMGNRIYLKINNLCGEKRRDKTLKPLSRENLHKIIMKFLENNEKWKGRIILINDSNAVTEYEQIEFY